MEFMQKAVFSNEVISKGILAVLGAVGEPAVKKAFEGAKESTRLKTIFKHLDGSDFYDMSFLKNYKNTNRLSYMSIDKALSHIPKFAKTSTFYGNEAATKRKFNILLESLSFLEADLILRMVLKNYDVDSVSNYLFPERLVEKVEQKRVTKSSLSKKHIENNELPKNDENATD